jgi:hypothetical protein
VADVIVEELVGRCNYSDSVVLRRQKFLDPLLVRAADADIDDEDVEFVRENSSLAVNLAAHFLEMKHRERHIFRPSWVRDSVAFRIGIVIAWDFDVVAAHGELPDLVAKLSRKLEEGRAADVEIDTGI